MSALGRIGEPQCNQFVTMFGLGNHGVSRVAFSRQTTALSRTWRLTGGYGV
jgi:hypothetical protein